MALKNYRTTNSILTSTFVKSKNPAIGYHFENHQHSCTFIIDNNLIVFLPILYATNFTKK